MKNILFLCTGNSCRSQMAEAWVNRLKSDSLTPYSAGVETHGLNPRAVEVMAEVGIDIADNVSKTVADLPTTLEFDYVVTLCSGARENCPYFPAKTRIQHVGFDDPPTLTQSMDDPEAVLAVYRRVRDEIREFVTTLPESLDA